jgi:hypothetical protein
MPVFRGHASIDFWLLNYRHVNGYRDINNPGFYGYHQSHLMTAIAPLENSDNCEQYLVSQDGILAALDAQSRWPADFPRRELRTSAEVYQSMKARTLCSHPNNSCAIDRTARICGGCPPTCTSLT